MQAMQTERQNRMAARNQAIKQFYSQLSAEQQKVFDQQTARGHGPEHGPTRHAAAKAITAKATAANAERGSGHPPRGMTAMRLTLLRQAFFLACASPGQGAALRFQEQIKDQKNALISRFDAFERY